MIGTDHPERQQKTSDPLIPTQAALSSNKTQKIHEVSITVRKTEYMEFLLLNKCQ